MDSEEFRVRGKEMVDFIASYLDTIRDRKVYPDVQPGYLQKLLPESAPSDPEPWEDIFKDVEDAIMPGIVHWQSPHMHAYFPALTSYPAILGDMLSSAFNNICFTWASSPAGTELETIAMNWLGKMIGLPEDFLHTKNDSPGGGVIQTTASEATLVSLLAARTRILMSLADLNPEMETSEMLGNLICYCSDQAHSSVEKAGLIGSVRMRYIQSDSNQCMRGPELEKAITIDKENGLVPFWVCATLGTTGSVAFDNLKEIGEVCTRHGTWLHVDAAYAGSCFVCPEFRHWLDGVEMANSFAFNPSKWLMVTFDCTAMWVKDAKALHRTFNVNPIYLRHENSGKAIDYMVNKDKIKLDLNNNIPKKNGFKHVEKSNPQKLEGEIKLANSREIEPCHWQIPLSRRFRALKLWFVLRSYGISGIQKHIRESVRLAQKLEALILADQRFEIPQARNLGMVCFRLKGDNVLTERLLVRLNARGNLHAVPACFKGIYVIRFTVTSSMTTNQDILEDWAEIKTVASALLKEEFGFEDGNIRSAKKPRISLKETRAMNAAFGTSLLLANSPMSPKVMNGSYAAICDYAKILSSCAHTFAQLQMEPKDSPEMRRRIRGIKISGKKLSLDSCMDMVQGLVIDPDTTYKLPLTEEEREELTSNGSSPGERNSQSSSPISSIHQKPDSYRSDLYLAPPHSRPYRSKSVDITLSGLEDSKVTFDIKKNEIVISPDNGTNSDSTLDDISPNDQFEDDKCDRKLTIKAPGNYIKKLIQQFSDAPLDVDGSREPKSFHLKEKADEFCKKCLHYKDKISK